MKTEGLPSRPGDSKGHREERQARASMLPQRSRPVQRGLSQRAKEAGSGCQRQGGGREGRKQQHVLMGTPERIAQRGSEACRPGAPRLSCSVQQEAGQKAKGDSADQTETPPRPGHASTALRFMGFQCVCFPMFLAGEWIQRLSEKIGPHGAALHLWQLPGWRIPRLRCCDLQYWRLPRPPVEKHRLSDGAAHQREWEGTRAQS